jgi:hypothetical protein
MMAMPRSTIAGPKWTASHHLPSYGQLTPDRFAIVYFDQVSAEIVSSPVASNFIHKTRLGKERKDLL